MNQIKIYLINDDLDEIGTIFDGSGEEFAKEYGADHKVDVGMLVQVNNELKQIYTMNIDWKSDTFSFVLAPKGISPYSEDGKKIFELCEHL